MLEDQVRIDYPGMINIDILARDAVVGILRGKSVAEVVVVVDAIGEIRIVPKNAVLVVELMVDTCVVAVVVVCTWCVREKVVRITETGAGLVRRWVQIQQGKTDGIGVRDLVPGKRSSCEVGARRVRL